MTTIRTFNAPDSTLAPGVVNAPRESVMYVVIDKRTGAPVAVCYWPEDADEEARSLTSETGAEHAIYTTRYRGPAVTPGVAGPPLATEPGTEVE